MAQTPRSSEILQIARREGRVTVDGLVAHFGVTPQTIRRDLTELADADKLERVHGGAILPSSTTNLDYKERRALNQAAKVDIARACAARIPNDCSVFLNIGTTTEAVAAELLQHQGLLVVTNNLNIAFILSSNPQIEVVVTGGALRSADGGMVGAMAAQATRQFRFDIAVVGCSALHESGDILDFDLHEVEVSQAIVERSAHVILAADASKFDRKAPARIASVADVDVFITDSAPPTSCLDLCRSHDTQVQVVGLP